MGRWQWLGLPIFEVSRQARTSAKGRLRNCGWPLNLRCLGLPNSGLCVDLEGETKLSEIEAEPVNDGFNFVNAESIGHMVVHLRMCLSTAQHNSLPEAARLRAWIARLQKHELELVNAASSKYNTKANLGATFQFLVDCVLFRDMHRGFSLTNTVRFLKFSVRLVLPRTVPHKHAHTALATQERTTKQQNKDSEFGSV